MVRGLAKCTSVGGQGGQVAPAWYGEHAASTWRPGAVLFPGTSGFVLGSFRVFRAIY